MLYHIRAFVSITWVLVSTLFIVEFPVLRGIDPWGANTYYGELGILNLQTIPDETRGYTLPVGSIDFARSGYYTDGRGWSVTMTENGRLVPNTAPSDCVIAVVGDSAAFGHAVRNEHTFTNILAGRFPGVEFRNLGINGYNTAQVLATIESSSADAYVYLMISNDAEPILKINRFPRNDLWEATHQYFYHWFKQRAVAKTNESEPLPLPDWFMLAMSNIAQRDNVLMFGFTNHILSQRVAVDYPDMILIPPYLYGISKADPHPSPVSHEQIADGIEPYIQTLVNDFCGEHA